MQVTEKKRGWGALSSYDRRVRTNAKTPSTSAITPIARPADPRTRADVAVESVASVAVTLTPASPSSAGGASLMYSVGAGLSGSSPYAGVFSSHFTTVPSEYVW